MNYQGRSNPFIHSRNLVHCFFGDGSNPPPPPCLDPSTVAPLPAAPPSRPPPARPPPRWPPPVRPPFASVSPPPFKPLAAAPGALSSPNPTPAIPSSFAPPLSPNRAWFESVIVAGVAAAGGTLVLFVGAAVMIFWCKSRVQSGDNGGRLKLCRSRVKLVGGLQHTNL